MSRNGTLLTNINIDLKGVLSVSHPRLAASSLTFVAEQLNAAKGRLRSILHYDLFKPNDQLLRARCPCRGKTLYNYEKTLYDIKVWPLERQFQRADMDTLLERMVDFSYEPHKSACGPCRTCYKHRQGYGAMVEAARTHTEGYFDGLCLDCAERTKSVTRDEHMDYWYRDSMNEDD